jgi:hypothetical protein
VTYYPPEKTRELVAWENQCDRDGKVKEAMHELLVARRLLELGDRLAFDEVRPGVFKMRGFDVYASTYADRERVAEIIRGREDEFRLCGVCDFDEARDWIAAGITEAPAVFEIVKAAAGESERSRL